VIRLCPADDIEEGDARGFTVGESPARRRIFVVRWDSAVKGYLNVCPHVGTPLDWVPDKFFHPDDRHLICATHGALFLPENGLCVAGPCEGDSLLAVDVAVEDGWIVYRG
jgi:nitrite reductase/ring-hydroxylating ferredoxin subunit